MSDTGETPEFDIQRTVEELSRITGQPEHEIWETHKRLIEQERYGLERYELRKAWLDSALRDERHMYETISLFRNSLRDPDLLESIRLGSFTLEQAGAMASISVSGHITGRHFGASVGVGRIVARMFGSELEN